MSQKSLIRKYRVVGTGIDRKWKGGPELFPELLVIRARSLQTNKVTSIHVPMRGCQTLQDARSYLAAQYPHGSILQATWNSTFTRRRR